MGLLCPVHLSVHGQVCEQESSSQQGPFISSVLFWNGQLSCFLKALMHLGWVLGVCLQKLLGISMWTSLKKSLPKLWLTCKMQTSHLIITWNKQSSLCSCCQASEETPGAWTAFPALGDGCCSTAVVEEWTLLSWGVRQKLWASSTSSSWVPFSSTLRPGSYRRQAEHAKKQSRSLPGEQDNEQALDENKLETLMSWKSKLRRTNWTHRPECTRIPLFSSLDWTTQFNSELQDAHIDLNITDKLEGIRYRRRRSTGYAPTPRVFQGEFGYLGL